MRRAGACGLWLATSLALAALVTSRSTAASEPDWLEAALSQRDAQPPAEAPAVELLRERIVAVNTRGEATRVTRFVLRIDEPEGARQAAWRFPYTPDTVRGHWLKAWHCPAGEPCTDRTGDHVTDQLADEEAVYGGVRHAVADLTGVARSGSVVAIERYEHDGTALTSHAWALHGTAPVLRSRFVVEAPEDWTVRAIVLRGEAPEPVVEGDRWTWNLYGHPGVPDEPLRPPVTRLEARLGVSVLPPEGLVVAGMRRMDSWADVSRWLADLADPTATPDRAIQARVRTHRSEVGGDVVRLIDALAREAQEVSYVSIQTGVGRGGGYRPRPASEVFEQRHGDCKDKVTLFRALASCIGLPARAVAVHAGDPSYVDERWPSPQQFDHAIAALPVQGGFVSDAAVDHPTLGRFVLFDPTDPATPLGQLPAAVQGGLALVLGDDTGTLLRLPVAPLESTRLERAVEARVQADGAIELHVEETARGEQARAWRMAVRLLSADEREDVVRAWFGRGSRDVEIESLDLEDREGAGAFRVVATMSLPRPGPVTAPPLIATRVLEATGSDAPDLGCSTRTLPIDMPRLRLEETSRVVAGAGHSLVELPSSVAVDGEAGRVAFSCREDAGGISCVRSVAFPGRWIPPERCAVAQEALDALADSDGALAVFRAP